ncbi:transcriptional regulator ATRX homolog [Ixodes scapularis]
MYEVSGKMILLHNILHECGAIGDKLLLFSQSLLTLDLVEKLLERCNELASAVQPDATAVDPSDPLRDCHSTWISGVDYFRMDGSTPVDQRKRWIEMFNNESNPRGRLFLISTRAGSLGTNLVGANRVVLMDTSWNPTHDVQAIFRVYRFGQKKKVFIYRLLAQQKAQMDGTHGTDERRRDEQRPCRMMQRRRRAGRQAMAGAIHHVVFVTYLI